MPLNFCEVLLYDRILPTLFKINRNKTIQIVALIIFQDQIICCFLLPEYLSFPPESSL